METKEQKLSLANFWDISYKTPWKFVNEICMYFIKPFVLIYLFLEGVKVGNNPKFYGFPKILRHKGSKITIGDSFEARSWKFSNPLGVNHPLILCTWSKDAEIVIGNDVGISGGSIVAAKKIEIGDRVLIGANSAIVDTDFHPLQGNKRYSKEAVRSFPVKIGDDVFIGMSTIILKGVEIKKGAIIGAGEVIRHG